MSTTAFIFAAGLGTRLYPLTANRPKALVCYEGVPLLERVIRTVTAAGIRNILVNVHHFPDQIIQFLERHDFGARIRVSDERAYLRDTAGGLKFAEPLLGDADTILLYNVDIISNLSIPDMLKVHHASRADVTLAVRQRATARYLVFDRQDMRLTGWRNITTNETLGQTLYDGATDLAFSGIHLVSRDFVKRLRTVEKTSLTPYYIQHAQEFNIKGYWHQQDEWMDIGKYNEYANILS